MLSEPRATLSVFPVLDSTYISSLSRTMYVCAEMFDASTTSIKIVVSKASISPTRVVVTVPV